MKFGRGLVADPVATVDVRRDAWSRTMKQVLIDEPVGRLVALRLLTRRSL
jgi:hypothetical protein